MSKLQYSYYLQTLNKTLNENSGNENKVTVDNSPLKINSNTKENIQMQNSLQIISNVIFPTSKKQGKNQIVVAGKYGFDTTDSGNGALYMQTKVSSVSKKQLNFFKYQKHAIYDIGTQKEKPFFDLDHLDKYSPKFNLFYYLYLEVWVLHMCTLDL